MEVEVEVEAEVEAEVEVEAEAEEARLLRQMGTLLAKRDDRPRTRKWASKVLLWCVLFGK
jgi:hypothetical protein